MIKNQIYRARGKFEREEYEQMKNPFAGRPTIKITAPVCSLLQVRPQGRDAETSGMGR
jgi:hypothetical protein